MSRPDKLTIVIITFNKDFKLLLKLLDSIYEFWNSEAVESIKIVFNDEVRYKFYFDKIVDKFKNKKIKIEKYYMFEMEPRLREFDWHSQQMAKCLISKYITTDWYIINDCKDYYISPISLDDCFDEEGRAIMHLDHARYNNAEEIPYPTSHWGFGPFNLAYQSCCDLWGLDPRDYKQFHLPYLTPFFVKTKNMSDMIDELKDTFKSAFPFMFSLYLNGQVFVTEFLLYNAYCTSKNNLADYVDWSVNHRKFFNCVQQSLEGRNSNGSRIMSNRENSDV